MSINDFIEDFIDDRFEKPDKKETNLITVSELEIKSPKTPLIIYANFIKMSKKETYKIYEIQENKGKAFGKLYINKNINVNQLLILLKK